MDNTENQTNDSPDVLRNQAWSYLKQGQYPAAIRSFGVLANSTKPTCNDYTGLGIALGGTGDWRQAAQVFGKAWSIQPGSSGTCANLLTALLQQGKIMDALAVMSDKRSVLPYHLGNRIMQRFATSREGVKYIKKQGWLASYLKLLEFLGLESNRARIASFIAASSLYPVPWREKALDCGSDEQIDKWVTWNGLKQITEPLDHGRGVILLQSHFTVSRTAAILLARKGYTVHSLNVWDFPRMYGVPSAQKITSVPIQAENKFFLRQVYAAKKILDSGAVFNIAGDGHHGQSSVSVNFLNREQQFRTGFAELALISNAPVVPVFCTVDLSGKIQIDAYPPLSPGEKGDDRQDRIRNMVQQYASLLENKFRSDPGNLTWQHMEKFVEWGFSFIK